MARLVPAFDVRRTKMSAVSAASDGEQRRAPTVRRERADDQSPAFTDTLAVIERITRMSASRTIRRMVWCDRLRPAPYGLPTATRPKTAAHICGQGVLWTGGAMRFGRWHQALLNRTLTTGVRPEFEAWSGTRYARGGKLRRMTHRIFRRAAATAFLMAADGHSSSGGRSTRRW